jgi:AcrR family transcriptional regulator
MISVTSPTDTTAEGPPQRGRRRDPRLDEAVLDATLALLGERGYARLRVSDVAARAGVGLGALYRRWPGKRDLVLAALGRAAPDVDLPRHDDPAADILAGLRLTADALRGPRGQLLSGLLAEFSADPDLATAVREAVIRPLRIQQRERLREVCGDVADLDIRADIGPSYVLFHGMILGRAVSDEELQAVLAIATGR